jgi:hypothetical protein
VGEGPDPVLGEGADAPRQQRMIRQERKNIRPEFSRKFHWTLGTNCVTYVIRYGGEQKINNDAALLLRK